MILGLLNKILRWAISHPEEVKDGVHAVENVIHPEPQGQPLPWKEVDHIRKQIDEGTSHKVK